MSTLIPLVDAAATLAAAVPELQAVDVITPETPPQSQHLLRLIRFLLWFVLTGGVVAIIWAGGKFAWEKWNGGGMESPKQLVGALVGGIIAVSASQIFNAVLPS